MLVVNVAEIGGALLWRFRGVSPSDMKGGEAVQDSAAAAHLGADTSCDSTSIISISGVGRPSPGNLRISSLSALPWPRGFPLDDLLFGTDK